MGGLSLSLSTTAGYKQDDVEASDGQKPSEGARAFLVLLPLLQHREETCMRLLEVNTDLAFSVIISCSFHYNQ